MTRVIAESYQIGAVWGGASSRKTAAATLVTIPGFGKSTVECEPNNAKINVPRWVNGSHPVDLWEEYVGNDDTAFAADPSSGLRPRPP